MVSSQLEVVSSSPFGCVLRDHDRKERCRESNARNVQAMFDKNFDDLVRDHINGYVSLPSPHGSKNQISHNNVVSWVTSEQANANQQQQEHDMKNNIPSASTIIPRPPPVLKRWVSMRYREHVNEATEPTTPMPSASTRKNAQNSPSQWENTSAKHNLGASSLVQIWEARSLNRSKSSNCINSNQNQSQSMDSNTSRTGTCVSSNENNAMEGLSTNDPFDEKYVNRTNNRAFLTVWEAASEASCSSCIRTFDTSKTERVRIVDIIKKLKNGGEDADDHERGNNDHKHCSTSDQAEQWCFSVAISSPQIRGRQAFNDLLIRKERDKIRELDSLVKRKPVSKFPKRGRLQSTLKLKSPQRCQTIQDRCRLQSPRAHRNRIPQWPTITQLREKFSTGSEHLRTPTDVSATSRFLQNDTNSTCMPQQREDTHCQKRDQSSYPVNRSTMNTNGDVYEQSKPLSDAIQQISGPAKATTPLEGQLENEVAEKQGSNGQQHLLLDSQETAKTITQNEVAEQEKDQHHHHLTLESQETMETPTSMNSSIDNEIGEGEGNGDRQYLGLDSRSECTVVKSSTSYVNDSNENEVTGEEEDHYQQYFVESNDYDWFTDISRPKSHWESLRKAWYEEVLNATSKNGEIRQLVERGRVSSLLASDFTESMDRLLTCRIQVQADGAENQQVVDDNYDSTSLGSDFVDRMNRLMTSGAQCQADEAQNQQEVEGKEKTVQPMSCKEEDYDDDKEEEEEEERSLSSHQCHEANNYYDHSSSSLQLPSPSALRSWSSQDGNETGNDYERCASEFSPPPQQSQAHCYQDARQSSSSIGMGLIYDLRGDIQQLRHEMSELRKSMLSCMDKQMKFQLLSFNWKVHSGETYFII
ncbi:Detected protein of unknown function [Hibiscus syriacus]|uniref:Uncharacterized protein n=1 Tax=Hibiscus syriacus TaxID=106335 RepID=A0A6A3AWX6_HIBSY|nr:Detected protein of unknown function [Hibiscus syriacus]